MQVYLYVYERTYIYYKGYIYRGFIYIYIYKGYIYVSVITGPIPVFFDILQSCRIAWLRCPSGREVNSQLIREELNNLTIWDARSSSTILFSSYSETTCKSNVRVFVEKYTIIMITQQSRVYFRNIISEMKRVAWSSSAWYFQRCGNYIVARCFSHYVHAKFRIFLAWESK